jgi:hypothetical protein
MWRTHVPHFALAEAPEIAPGVSLVAYGNDDALEYDLRVAPGADIANLRVEISGADGKRIDATGDLVMTIAGHEARMKKSIIYEERHQTASARLARETVNGSYKLLADGTVLFEVAAHDPAATLVIDPSSSVAYSTFLGGTGADSGNSIALDTTGKIHIGGTTTSATTFVETSGTSVGSGGGPSDYFIAKLDPSQTGVNSLVYLTFIGAAATKKAAQSPSMQAATSRLPEPQPRPTTRSQTAAHLQVRRTKRRSTTRRLQKSIRRARSSSIPTSSAATAMKPRSVPAESPWIPPAIFSWLWTRNPRI